MHHSPQKTKRETATAPTVASLFNQYILSTLFSPWFTGPLCLTSTLLWTKRTPSPRPCTDLAAILHNSYARWEATWQPALSTPSIVMVGTPRCKELFTHKLWLLQGCGTVTDSTTLACYKDFTSPTFRPHFRLVKFHSIDSMKPDFAVILELCYRWLISQGPLFRSRFAITSRNS
jgi:hypothetical protein